MKLSTKNIVRKINRELELASGRVSYNRVHANKKAYNRKKNRKIINEQY